MKIFKNKKLTICYTLLILMFILMGNSNNNPSPYIERIFKPINFDNGTFYYSTIIVMIVVYYCLKLINNEKENNFINSFLSRIIVAVIFISGSVWLNTYCTKFYKSFSHNLNSIYMNRDETSVAFDVEEKKLSLNGKISIFNCSNEVQEFSIKIKSPSYMKKHIGKDYVVLKNKVRIYPREERNLYINEQFDFDIKDYGSGYTGNAFEYILFDDEEDIVFKGSVDDYFVDEMDWS